MSILGTINNYILQWWERHTYPQDEEMNKRVKELQEQFRKKRENKK